MDFSMLLEYGWVLVLLVALEGLLAADNALVLAIMVKHLPESDRKRALFYGLAGAFVFRLASLFIISYLVDVWQIQAIGALYLLFIAINHIVRKVFIKKPGPKVEKEKKQSGFWATVIKVELADIAFAVDSILAAVAMAMTLPDTPLPAIGGMDGGKFIVVFAGADRADHYAVCRQPVRKVAALQTRLGNCRLRHRRLGRRQACRFNAGT